MRFAKVFSIITMVLFIGLYCGSEDSDYVNVGKGGPENTSEDITIDDAIVENNDLQDVSSVDQDEEDLFTTEDEADESEISDEQKDGEGDEIKDSDESTDSASGDDETKDDTDEEDSGEGTEVTDDGEGEDSGDTTDVAQTDDESEKGDDTTDTPTPEIAEPTVTLDSSSGRWYKSPKQKLVDDETYTKHIALIKKYRSQIKDLKVRKKESGVDVAAIKDEIKKYRSLIKKSRLVIGYGKHQKGIHTFWSNENLFLRIRDNQRAGWYKIVMVAKNIKGPLSEKYSHFNITVWNETNGKQVGGMNIMASDNRYHRDKMFVYLDEGDTDLNLLWSNDYYVKEKYDANIQIKKVRIKYAKAYNKSRKSLVRNANQYSFIEGRWFWDKNTVRTYWANQLIGFSFSDMKSGKYRIILTAKNYGKLSPDYTDFKVDVEADGVGATISIPANEKKFKKGNAILDLTGGDIDVSLIWTNDMWVPNKYDTNIQIKKIKLKRIDDSERSALAAYLIATVKGNRGLITGILLIVLITLGSIFMWNKKRVKE
ncbi:MAG: hypothetical protein SVZ03_08735 [Spirochaetota bacterium]|nr:hypothetical protein [Spirochaetota bacterium]